MLRLTSIILCFFLTACGFHPRGEVTLAPPLKNIYLKTSDPYGQLAHNLENYLTMTGVHLATHPENASSVLVILSEKTDQQLLSISGTQLTRQYILSLSVTFSVTDPQGRVLIAPQTSVEKSSLTIQSNQILGGSNEAASLYEQMRSTIVYDIVNRLSSESATSLLTHTTKKR